MGFLDDAPCPPGTLTTLLMNDVEVSEVCFYDASGLATPGHEALRFDDVGVYVNTVYIINGTEYTAATIPAAFRGPYDCEDCVRSAGCFDEATTFFNEITFVDGTVIDLDAIYGVNTATAADVVTEILGYGQGSGTVREQADFPRSILCTGANSSEIQIINSVIAPVSLESTVGTFNFQLFGRCVPDNGDVKLLELCQEAQTLFVVVDDSGAGGPVLLQDVNSSVQVTGLSIDGVAAAVDSASDTLYVLSDSAPQDLFVVDLISMTLTSTIPLAPSPVTPWRNLDWHAPSGLLYSYDDTVDILYSINPGTGAVVAISGPFVPATSPVDALAIDAAGNVYIGSGSDIILLNIGPDTSSVVFSSAIISNLNGMTFDPNTGLLWVWEDLIGTQAIIDLVGLSETSQAGGASTANGASAWAAPSIPFLRKIVCSADGTNLAVLGNYDYNLNPITVLGEAAPCTESSIDLVDSESSCQALYDATYGTRYEICETKNFVSGVYQNTVYIYNGVEYPTVAAVETAIGAGPLTGPVSCDLPTALFQLCQSAQALLVAVGNGPSPIVLEALDGSTSTTGLSIQAESATVNGNTLYALSASGPQDLIVIDLISMTVTNTIPLVGAPSLFLNMAWNPASNTIYTYSDGTQELFEIDPISGVVSLVTTGFVPGISPASAMAIDAGGNIYVGSDDEVHLLDTIGATHAVVFTSGILTDISGLTFDDTGMLWAFEDGNPTQAVIDLIGLSESPIAGSSTGTGAATWVAPDIPFLRKYLCSADGSPLIPLGDYDFDGNPVSVLGNVVACSDASQIDTDSEIRCLAFYDDTSGQQYQFQAVDNFQSGNYVNTVFTYNGVEYPSDAAVATAIGGTLNGPFPCNLPIRLADVCVQPRTLLVGVDSGGGVELQALDGTVYQTPLLLDGEAATVNGNILYVMSSGGPQTITAVDLLTMSIISTVPLVAPPGLFLNMAWNPSTSTIYAYFDGTQEMYEIDPNSGVTTLVATGFVPGVSPVTAMAIDASGTIYLGSDQDVHVLDMGLLTNTIVFSTGFLGEIHGMVFDPSGSLWAYESGLPPVIIDLIGGTEVNSPGSSIVSGLGLWQAPSLPFLRKYLCELDGTPLVVLGDYDYDGNPYVPTGTVGPCVPEDSLDEVVIQRLCESSASYLVNTTITGGASPVTLFNLETDTATAVGSIPDSIANAIDPDANILYAIDPSDNLFTYDLVSNTIGPVIGLITGAPAGGFQSGVWHRPSGTIYSYNNNDDTLYSINPTTAVATSIVGPFIPPIPTGVSGITIDNNGDIYVTETSSSDLYRLNLGAVSTTLVFSSLLITVGTIGLTYSPDSDTFFMSENGGNTVEVDLTTYTETTRIFGTFDTGAEFWRAPAKQFYRKYLCDVDGSIMSLIGDFDLDGLPYSPTGVVEFCEEEESHHALERFCQQADRFLITSNSSGPGGPITFTSLTTGVAYDSLVHAESAALSVDPITNTLYSLSRSTLPQQTLTTIDLTTQTVLSTFPLIGGPGSDFVNSAWNAATGEIYAYEAVTNTLYAIDPTTHVVSVVAAGFVPGIASPTGMAIDPATGNVYVADGADIHLLDVGGLTTSIVFTSAIVTLANGLTYDRDVDRFYLSEDNGPVASISLTTGTESVLLTPTTANGSAYWSAPEIPVIRKYVCGADGTILTNTGDFASNGTRIVILSEVLTCGQSDSPCECECYVDDTDGTGQNNVIFYRCTDLAGVVTDWADPEQTIPYVLVGLPGDAFACVDAPECVGQIADGTTITNPSPSVPINFTPTPLVNPLSFITSVTATAIVAPITVNFASGNSRTLRPGQTVTWGTDGCCCNPLGVPTFTIGVDAEVDIDWTEAALS